MRKMICLVILFSLASCASVSNYPLELSYKPGVRNAPAAGGAVTVVLFNDKRKVAEKRVIGMKDDETRFVSLIGEPSSAVAGAFRAYLEAKGYKAAKVDEPWDGTAGSLRPEWGDVVVGGDIEELDITVYTGFPKTKYVCSVKLFVTMADAVTKTVLHQERVEASSSYLTVYFSRDRAEELINGTLADAMEKTLAKIGDYLPKRR